MLNVHPTLTHNTSCHLFGVFYWKGGGGGVRRTSYSRYSSISFQSRQKKTWVWWYWLARFISDSSSRHDLPTPVFFFPNKIERNHQKYNSVIFYHLGVGTKRRGKNGLFCFFRNQLVRECCFLTGMEHDCWLRFWAQLTGRYAGSRKEE